MFAAARMTRLRMASLSRSNASSCHVSWWSRSSVELFMTPDITETSSGDQFQIEQQGANPAV
jgi:hypothetical protein